MGSRWYPMQSCFVPFGPGWKVLKWLLFGYGDNFQIFSLGVLKCTVCCHYGHLMCDMPVPISLWLHLCVWARWPHLTQPRTSETWMKAGSILPSLALSFCVRWCSPHSGQVVTPQLNLLGGSKFQSSWQWRLTNFPTTFFPTFPRLCWSMLYFNDQVWATFLASMFLFEGKVSPLKGGRKGGIGSEAVYMLFGVEENALGRAGWGKHHMNI